MTLHNLDPFMDPQQRCWFCESGLSDNCEVWDIILTSRMSHLLTWGCNNNITTPMGQYRRCALVSHPRDYFHDSFFFFSLIWVCCHPHGGLVWGLAHTCLDVFKNSRLKGIASAVCFFFISWEKDERNPRTSALPKYTTFTQPHYYRVRNGASLPKGKTPIGRPNRSRIFIFRRTPAKLSPRVTFSNRADPILFHVDFTK